MDKVMPENFIYLFLPARLGAANTIAPGFRGTGTVVHGYDRDYPAGDDIKYRIREPARDCPPYFFVDIRILEGIVLNL